MNLDTRLSAARLFVARAIHPSEGDEQCAQPFFQPATQLLRYSHSDLALALRLWPWP